MSEQREPFVRGAETGTDPALAAAAYSPRVCPDPRLDEVDLAVVEALEAERKRQEESIELIASENYVSQAVLDAVGSMATNKYAEGYPGKRYYGGCEHVDKIEQLAIDRAKKLYGAEHVNVQTHAGSQANMAIYLAMLKPGDTILAMSLDHGGHLTHGFRLNYSGRFFNAVTYGVRADTERIDYDDMRKKALEHRPRLVIAGASAYPRIIDFDLFADAARDVGALFMADIAHIAGAVSTWHHPSPLPLADFVTATTHKTLRGPRGGLIMCKSAWAKKVDAAVFPGMQGGPLMHVIAGKAVAFGEALTPAYRDYIGAVHGNARAMSDEMRRLGYRIVTGGTDNHLFLVDLGVKNVTGAAAAKALERAGITVNKNLIPFDKRPPIETSGIRLGTPAMTTRCLGADEMRRIARWIDRVLSNLDDEKVIAGVRGETLEFCRQFPIPAVHRLGRFGI
ncbi:MAG: serine hydroxymethyltransferase [Deltaproteobacteria bacterium]|nr:serine hydroxymethyltransferase [Deltaproteobacteria bacterium]